MGVNASKRGEHWALRVVRMPAAGRRPPGRDFAVQLGSAYQCLSADELRELRAQIDAALLADEPDKPEGPTG